MKAYTWSFQITVRLKTKSCFRNSHKKKEGYNCSLIAVSNAKYVSKEYEEIIRKNYETGKIAFGKLESLLGFIGKNPADFGYEVPDDD
ncbi:MAG: hypothetical protein E4H16_00340 [Candidatus Atribacteria bacterium]|nr:MAG: hypothetical protein E4H16_00340 [Candidatus Atribacteria bacterium]